MIIGFSLLTFFLAALINKQRTPCRCVMRFAFHCFQSLQQYEKIQVEVEILRSLRHKNIVSYLGTSMQLSTVYIFMEYISGGSLQSILKR